MKGTGYLNIGFKRYFAYKARVISKLVSSPIELVIMIVIWTAIFSNSGQELISGFTLQEMINYYITIWIMSLIVSDYTDQRLGENIYFGLLSVRLLNPLKIHIFYLFDAIGDKVGALVIQLIPFLTISALMGFAPASAINFILFITTAILGFLIAFYFNLLFGLIAFKLKQYRYASRIKNTIVSLVSGKVLPLTIFPATALAVINLLPFNYVYFAPAMILLGKQNALLVIITQLIWITVLYALFRIGFNKSLKSFEGIGI